MLRCITAVQAKQWESVNPGIEDRGQAKSEKGGKSICQAWFRLAKDRKNKYIYIYIDRSIYIHDINYHITINASL